jgi:hypothetical protein
MNILAMKKWLLVLAIWLILSGLMAFLSALRFEGMHVLMAVLAILAGVLILIDK